MNSCLYACRVMHDRLEPKRHRFDYSIFMWYLDLNELDSLVGRLWLMSRNHFNLFNFRDADHLPGASTNLKDNLISWVRSKGFRGEIQRVMLLTHLRTLGYLFNPVSFYFCFDAEDQPVCAVAEVGNTFREMKPYYLGPETLQHNRFARRVVKNFYVSPFIDLDTEFDFQMPVPEGLLGLVVNDYQEGRKFFISTLSGERRALTNARLLGYALRFPLITLQIIGLIHWQALKLYWKKLPFIRKAANPHLQVEVYHAGHSVS
jgi:uncharacterized protein